MTKSNELQLSLRETRMLLERIFQHVGIAEGLLHSVKDCALYSAALGLTSCDELTRHVPALEQCAPQRMRVLTEDADAVHIDAGGQHAWIVAESALDLAIDRFRRTGAAQVRVSNAREPKELGVVAGLAEAHGLSASAQTQADGTVVISVGPRDAARQTLLDLVRREGLPATHEAWSELLELSKKALAPDSPLSRTHNGDIMVRPDGTVVGRRDEEYGDMDLSLLVNAGFGNTQAPPVAGKRADGRKVS
jgi:hypothetical protein